MLCSYHRYYHSHRLLMDDGAATSLPLSETTNAMQVRDQSLPTMPVKVTRVLGKNLTTRVSRMSLG
jgi:hypothetical protein